MKKILPPMGSLRAFEASARLGSFTAAALELGLTQAAISKQVRVLENYFGEALFHRNPNELKLNQIGEAYLPTVKSSLDSLAAGTRTILTRNKHNSCRLRVQSSFAVLWLAPRMQQLYSRFPDTEFRLSSFNWEIEDENTSCDIEIRFGDPDTVQNEVIKLFDEKVFPVCSPELLRQVELNQPKDLENSLLFEVFGNRMNWASWFDHANITFTPNFKVQRVDSANLAYASVANGFGVALGWKSLVSHQLETKQLIEPFNIRADTSQGFYAQKSPEPDNRELSNQVIDWIIQQA